MPSDDDIAKEIKNILGPYQGTSEVRCLVILIDLMAEMRNDIKKIANPPIIVKSKIVWPKPNEGEPFKKA